MNQKLEDLWEKHSERVYEIRHQIHMHPEVGFEEYETSKLIASELEKLGIEVTKENLELVHIYHRYKKDSMKFVFKIKDYKGELTNNELDKHEKMEWYNIEELPKEIFPVIKKEIMNIENGIFCDVD